ncbi:hypothetical protein [Nocardioides sp. B-3]|uniref:hypothetical protein n=1 Tax=Nocardioides sp. B-3 TaxID=2895565 RepID=UPI00300DE0FA
MARRDALELGLNRKDGAGALLAATDTVSGLLGSVAALLSVEAGYEAAVAAALGTAADAVVVTGADAAIDAIAHLKKDDLGRAGLLLGGGPADDAARPALPAHAAYALDVVEAPADLRPAVARLLFKIAVVDDLPTARALIADLPDVTAVTRDGDLIGAHFAAGGSSSQPSLLEIRAAVDEAVGQLRGGDRVDGAPRVRDLPARGRAARRPQAHRRRARQAARVRRDAGGGGRGAGSVRLPGALRPGRGRAARTCDRDGRGRSRDGQRRSGGPRAAALHRRGSTRRRTRRLRARAPRRGGQGHPSGRDGCPPDVAHHRGTSSCAQRSRRLARARRPGPSATPGRAQPSAASG